MEETQDTDNLLERELEIFNSKVEQIDIWLTGIPLFKNGDLMTTAFTVQKLNVHVLHKCHFPLQHHHLPLSNNFLMSPLLRSFISAFSSAVWSGRMFCITSFSLKQVHESFIAAVSYDTSNSHLWCWLHTGGTDRDKQHLWMGAFIYSLPNVQISFGSVIQISVHKINWFKCLE